MHHEANGGVYSIIVTDVIMCLWSFLHCSKKRQQWFSVAALRHMHMVILSMRLDLASCYDCCSQGVLKVSREVIIQTGHSFLAPVACSVCPSAV